MPCPKILIAGTHSGVGKTTVSLALMAAFRARGRQVQPFKAGPDFIDPGHHKLACGRESRNLDGWMLGAELNRKIFIEASKNADIAIIEGMMGLFDGASPVSEQGSTAEIAKQVNASVLLVVDGSAMARSAAAMVSGYAKFDPDLKILGVLFNRVRSEGHFRLLQEAVESSLEIPVVGYLPPNEGVTIADRHLGLRTALEEERTSLYETLGRMAGETVNLDVIEELALSGQRMDSLGGGAPEMPPMPKEDLIRVGVAYDPAFCFYYQDNLELLNAAGGEIIRFSPMTDPALPDVDLVYFGGGYPELYAKTLEANAGMRQSIQKFARDGGVIFAECGGLMYLTQSIMDFEGGSFEMVGIFPGSVTMNRKSLTLGYREIEIMKSCILGDIGTKVRGHEFHYSSFIPNGKIDYACQWWDVRSPKQGADGLIQSNVMALYTHLHFASQPSIPRTLVQKAVLKNKRSYS